MTTVIGFLELMGSDAKLRTADGEEVGRAMEMAGLDASARNAILTDDQDSIEAMAGVSANVFCGLHAPDDAPGEGTPPAPSEPEEAPPAVAPRKRGGKKKAGKKKKKPAPAKKKAPASKKKAGKKKAGKKKAGKKKKSGKKKASRKKK